MFKTVLAAAVIALSSGAAQALCTGESLADLLTPEEQAEMDRVVAETPYAQGRVFTATRGDDHLTLVGTLHLHDARNAPFVDSLSDAINGAELVMLEMTPAEEERAKRAALEQPDLIFITEGPTLPERLDEATWQRLADAARTRQIPPIMAAKFQPWYLAMSLGVPVCAMADMMEGRRGVDHAIMARATDQGIPLQAVEPWDTIFDLLSAEGPEAQLEMLELAATSDELQAQATVAMLNGYFAGNIGEVWQMSRIAARRMPGMSPEEADAMFAETQAIMLDQRNMAWVPVIEEATATHDRILIAVGAAHLPGENGVLRLLEKNGWTIARR